jgi:cation diffusion facilitator family transporter
MIGTPSRAWGVARSDVPKTGIVRRSGAFGWFALNRYNYEGLSRGREAGETENCTYVTSVPRADSAPRSGADRAAGIGLIGILVGSAVLALKYYAYVATGSVALYSDALESIINVVVAVTTYAALRVSAKPADEKHPYGYTKVEYFSAVLEGLLIFLAAIAILRQAYEGFSHPRILETPLVGLLLNGCATVLNGAWCTVLLKKGREWRSPALSADGKHLLTDIVTSVGVFIGVGLVALTGRLWLDPAVACLVALNIMSSGWGLVRESVSGLLDEAVPADVLSRIRSVLSAHSEGALQVHDLRTRRAARRIFVDFHLVVPGSMSVATAHDICDSIEDALQEHLDAIVTIHVEPEWKAERDGVLFT